MSSWYSRWIWKKLYIFYLDTKVYNSVPFRPRQNQVAVLCNTFVDILCVLFCSFQLPCNSKSLKISTAYEDWFSSYGSSNLMLTTDVASVLVFVNFCGRCIVTDVSLTRTATVTLSHYMVSFIFFTFQWNIWSHINIKFGSITFKYIVLHYWWRLYQHRIIVIIDILGAL